MMRTADDAGALARVPANDGTTLAHLRNMDRTPVGSVGDIVTADDGVLEWRGGVRGFEFCLVSLCGGLLFAPPRIGEADAPTSSSPTNAPPTHVRWEAPGTHSPP